MTISSLDIIKNITVSLTFIQSTNNIQENHTFEYDLRYFDMKKCKPHVVAALSTNVTIFLSFTLYAC